MVAACPIAQVQLRPAHAHFTRWRGVRTQVRKHAHARALPNAHAHACALPHATQVAMPGDQVLAAACACSPAAPGCSPAEPAAPAAACHVRADEHGAAGRDCSTPPAGRPPPKRKREAPPSLRWADDTPSGELNRVAYVETMHGLPMDASEREQRAFFASLHRSKLRQQAAKREHAQRTSQEQPTKPLALSAAYLLCKGGAQGALQSAQALELELRMSLDSE